MTQAQMIEAMEQIKELEVMAQMIKDELDTVKDSIKNEMSLRGLDTMEIGDYVVRWTDTLTSRLDTKAFKEDHLDLYKAYTKQVASKRFTYSF